MRSGFLCFYEENNISGSGVLLLTYGCMKAVV